MYIIDALPTDTTNPSDTQKHKQGLQFFYQFHTAMALSWATGVSPWHRCSPEHDRETGPLAPGIAMHVHSYLHSDGSAHACHVGNLRARYSRAKAQNVNMQTWADWLYLVLEDATTPQVPIK